MINPFLVTSLFLYTLKTPENQRFPNVFRWCKKANGIKWVNVTNDSCYACYNGKKKLSTKIKYKKITDPKSNVFVRSKYDFKTRFLMI